MNRRQYDHDRYDKMYDMIELIYLLNRLSSNSYVDEGSKKYLVGMLENVESMKSNFDKYRDDETYVGKARMNCCKCDGCYSNDSDSFLDRIIFYLKTLNN